MNSRIFALIIGIDIYQSGGIWNLHSCAEDAKKMKRWLMNRLNVPREQILLLLDSRATKQAIEDSFMGHLVNNPSIERGDSLVIYFAGHGSCLSAPSGWFEDDSNDVLVNVICPYDHDAKVQHGRNAGISDRSLISLLEQLQLAKGDNITVILDCCFSPVQTPANILDRSITRWTKTSKATPDDLYRGLWPAARGKTHSTKPGLFDPTSAYTLLAACPIGQKAIEGKDGGRFTTALLDTTSKAPIHRSTYTQLIDDLASTGESQKFVCLGKHRDRVLFDNVPFSVDKDFSMVSFEKGTKLIKIDLGEIHGIVDGSELTVHLHNQYCSLNPPIAVSIVQEVHSTYCLARIKSQSSDLPEQCWAKLSQWNNRRPFCVYLKSTFSSFMRVLRLKRSIRPSNTSPSGPFKNGVHILLVKEPSVADVSVALGKEKSVILAQNNHAIPEEKPHTIHIEHKDAVEVIDDAALFNLHLLHQNVDHPLQKFIDLELHQLDPISWSKVGQNRLHNGQATIGYDNGAVYNIVLHNKSKIDIWPYIFYMDPNHHRITLIYNPNTSSKLAPLPGEGSLEIGAGRLGPETHPSTISQQNHVNFAYLKLYLSSAPVNMNLLQKDPFPQGITPNSFMENGQHLEAWRSQRSDKVIWDTSTTFLMFLRDSET